MVQGRWLVLSLGGSDSTGAPALRGPNWRARSARAKFLGSYGSGRLTLHDFKSFRKPQAATSSFNDYNKKDHSISADACIAQDNNNCRASVLVNNATGKSSMCIPLFNFRQYKEQKLNEKRESQSVMTAIIIIFGEEYPPCFIAAQQNTNNLQLTNCIICIYLTNNPLSQVSYTKCSSINKTHIQHSQLSPHNTRQVYLIT